MKYFHFCIIYISKKVGTTFLVWIVQIYIKIVEVISRNLEKCEFPRRNLSIIAYKHIVDLPWW